MIQNTSYNLFKSEDEKFYIEYMDNYYKINSNTHLLLIMIKQGSKIDEIAKKMKIQESEIEIFFDEIHNLIHRKKKEKSIIELFNIIGQPICNRIGHAFKILYKKHFLIGLSIISIVANLFFILKNDFQTLNININLSYYFICLFFIMLIHENGHISAAYNYGLRNLTIKFGVYLIWPVLYVDLNKQLLLHPSKRIIISFGGVYFQLIFSLILILIHNYYKSSFLETLLFVNSLIIIINLLPVLILDGYWIYSDIFHIENLNKKSKELIKKSFINIKYLIDAPLKLSLYAVARSITLFLIFSWIIKLIYIRIIATSNISVSGMSELTISNIGYFLWWIYPFALLIIYVIKKIYGQYTKRHQDS